eukprot:SM000126S26293  [mRNA]  locus=s126:35899:37789:- [translate_table: standard]
MASSADFAPMPPSQQPTAADSLATSQLSAPSPSSASAPTSKPFGRKQSVHQMLGGGQVADVLLWRKWTVSSGILGVATLAWILFEWSGYTLLTLLANTLLILVAAVFVWAQAAAFLNRAPPPLPALSLSEDNVLWAAGFLRTEINKTLAIAHSVALGKDVKLFIKVIVGLYLLATIGAWFNFLSLVFLVVLLAFTLPLFYDKYEDDVDKFVKIAVDEFNKVYKTVEQQILSRIPKGAPKEKKLQ